MARGLKLSNNFTFVVVSRFSNNNTASDVSSSSIMSAESKGSNFATSDQILRFEIKNSNASLGFFLEKSLNPFPS